MVEKGWACVGGTTTNEDVCYLLPKAYVVNMTLNSDNSIATIYFNESVLLDKLWTKQSMSVYVEGPKAPYAMTW